jgi:hypothetical protein
MVEVYGEIDAPNYGAPERGTTAGTTAFFRRTLAEWKSLDPNHLVSTGGLSYINNPGSGINWRAIMAIRNNATCGVEVNSSHDRNVSVPAVSSYCRRLGKPWFLSAWSSCHRKMGYPNDISSWPSDAGMAAHARDMYNVARDRRPAPPRPAMAAVGTDFWNLGNGPATFGTCDIGRQFPKTLGVVQANAP